MLCKICNKELDKKCSWVPCQLTQLLRGHNNETSRSKETSTVIDSEKRG